VVEEECDYVLPPQVNNERLYALLGVAHTCPWCGRARIPEKRSGRFVVRNQLWFETPLVSSPPRWICQGCAIDIYSDCTSSFYDENGGTGLVRIIAEGEGVNPDEFRRRCLEHQRSIVNQHLAEGRDPGYGWLVRRLSQLLD